MIYRSLWICKNVRSRLIWQLVGEMQYYLNGTFKSAIPCAMIDPQGGVRLQLLFGTPALFESLW